MKTTVTSIRTGTHTLSIQSRYVGSYRRGENQYKATCSCGWTDGQWWPTTLVRRQWDDALDVGRAHLAAVAS
ncbi:MAG: hypothetical protein ACRDYZ_11970 [Acidimicrobiales bacterium]